MTSYEAYRLSHAAKQFETILIAELQLVDIYAVTKRRGYNSADLIEHGEVLFPPDLAKKVPDAIKDIRQSTRCIAFGLPTAAGFHLHRANERVLHAYYDIVTSGATRPTSRNMGGYLDRLNQLGVGNAAVKAALKDLKDLHRNPLIHPEHSLETIDEAIALLGSIHAAITYMLNEIPSPPAAGTSLAVVATNA